MVEEGRTRRLTRANVVLAAVKVARHPSLVGLAGIVVQETEGTFRIVTPKNKIKGVGGLISSEATLFARIRLL